VTDKRLEQLEQRTGLHFENRSLLQEAMTHRSYVNEHDDPDTVDNERLEFLGDSVLGFISADLLYRRFPSVGEGELTRRRSALVRTESLAELADTCGIGETLRMGKGEELSGGRQRATNLCGAFEALVGALYIDQGLEQVRAFVLPLLNRQLEMVLAEQLDKDARSLLQEWSQATHNQTPQYRTVSESGPDHEKTFTVEVVIGEQVVGSGQGRSKQTAAQAAARDGLKRVQEADAGI
jgi:ribonuclease-3